MIMVTGQFNGIVDLWQNHIKSQVYESQNRQVLDFVKKSSHGYVLYQDPETNLTTIDIIIASPINDQTWSYKIYNEQSYPFYFQCTKTLLVQSTNDHPRAIEWRNRCMQNILAAQSKRKILSCIGDYFEKGMIINSQTYGQIEFLEYTQKNKAFIGLHLASNREFTFRFGLLQLEELEQLITNAIHNNQDVALKAS